MAITNGLITLDAAKYALGIQDNDDDEQIEYAVEVASRALENLCGRGRKFWQDSTVVARKFYPSEACRVYVNDISTLTGLVVKVDQGDDGTFETTLTIDTDFIVEPVNAAAEYPVQPWTSIRLLSGSLSSFPVLSSGRPSVEVTAKFGWSAVPEAVERACVLHTRTVYKAIQTQNSGLQLSVDGTVLRVPAVEPIVRMMMEPFVRYSEVDDGA